VHHGKSGCANGCADCWTQAKKKKSTPPPLDLDNLNFITVVGLLLPFDRDLIDQI
jgi:hypothetical protein